MSAGEYPGKEGGSESFSPDDLANFLLFFQELRSAVGNDVILSACGGSSPWVDSSGSPSTDLSAFGDVLDLLEIMQSVLTAPTLTHLPR